MWHVARSVRAGKSSYSDNKTTRATIARVVYILDRWRDQNSEVK